MTTRIPIYQVDAFTDRLFGGNPAAVCVVDRWLDTETLQAIAAENNLSETAFITRDHDVWAIRWFTPCIEVDLCGHATLAAGHVVLRELEPHAERVLFRTQWVGDLFVERDGDRLALDFPPCATVPADVDHVITRALGVEPLEIHASKSWLAVLPSEDAVRAVKPDFDAIAALDRDGVIITAPGDRADFVSRYFAPHAGIPEDPVTGSAHCTLTPFWAQRLGKASLVAHQVSKRGGALWCELRADRVRIAGHAVRYLTGFIEV